MSDRAPEPITERIRWYLGLWGLELLAIATFAQAWSLTIAIRFRGDLPTRRFMVCSSLAFGFSLCLRLR